MAVRRPLTQHQLGQAIAAVQALADLDLSSLSTATSATASVTVVFVPDEKGVLAPAGELAFNDAPWVLGGAAGAGVGGLGGEALGGAGAGAGGAGPAAARARLVHPKISNHVAER